MAIEPEESLPGGVTPQFVVEVSAGGTTYWSGTRPSSINELTAAWRGAVDYKSPITAILIAIVVTACLAAIINGWLFLAVISLGGMVLAFANIHAEKQRRVAIVYRSDVPATLAFDTLSRGVDWLAHSRAVWRVTHQELAQRPANMASVRRVDAHVKRGDVPNLLTNIVARSIAAGGETLVFLPDAIVIRGHVGSIDVPYSAVGVEHETTRFSESQLDPGDSRRVGASWLYSNKDGSPDRRRANNRQIPVLEYVRVTLSWQGTGWVLLVSNAEAARHFARSVQAMAQLGHPQPLVIASPAPRVATQPRAEVRPKPAPIPLVAAPSRAEPMRTVIAAPVSATKSVPVMPIPEVKMPVPRPTAPTELELALQASIDRKRRIDELERQAAASRVQSESACAPVVAAQPAGEWLGPGRSATVQGFTTGDCVYFGGRLPALDGSGPEPALINPALSVDPAHANSTGSGMTYWPSYAGISAASRRAFLQWLAGGREDPDAYIGYVFIFFYGLERRVCELLQVRDSNDDELLAIAREVARLLGLYAGKSNSFASYGRSFLELIASIDSRARGLYREEEYRGYGVSQRLKILLGELSLAGKPIPAQHALEWLRSTSSLNTPAMRCASEFELLFHIRYARRFGDGLVVKPNRTFVDRTYRPASAALATLSTRQCEIPDITQLSRPLAKLNELAQECSGALDAFSRFLGKNAEGRESLAAFALLPEELIEATPSNDATSLASLVRSRLDENGRAHLGAGELLQYVRLAKPDKVSKNEAMLLAQALEKLGYGIEPDVRLGGPVYDLDGRVVVFRRLSDCPSFASEEYAVATLLVRLGAMVSAADAAVLQSERELLERHIEERLLLSAGERQRLAAHLAWLLDSDLGMTGLKRRLESLPRDARRAIGELLVDVAATDGHVDAREMKVLEKLYELLDLPRSELYRDVHAAQSQDNEPIAVDTPAAAPKGFAIPPKPAPVSTVSGIDMDRVRLKIAETRQVSTLLSSIFVEEEVQLAAAVVTIGQANTIGTLDAAHSELLRRLAGRESWPRDEIESLAADLSLLPDGALETINDYAYATLDEPLWEDDDPVAINPKVARELIA